MTLSSDSRESPPKITRFPNKLSRLLSMQTILVSKRCLNQKKTKFTASDVHLYYVIKVNPFVGIPRKICCNFITILRAFAVRYNEVNILNFFETKK